MAPWPLPTSSAEGPAVPPGCALVLPGPVADPVAALRDGDCAAVVVADYQQIVIQALESCLVAMDREIVHRPVYEAPPRCVTRQRDSLAKFAADWARWIGAENGPQHEAGSSP